MPLNEFRRYNFVLKMTQVPIRPNDGNCSAANALQDSSVAHLGTKRINLKLLKPSARNLLLTV